MSGATESLATIARKVRKNIYLMADRAGGAHIGPSFSVVEILTALYFEVMRHDPKKPDWPKRDRFVLSKGHASVALYAVLAEAGYFDKELLYTYCQPGSILGGHPNMHEVPGVEASTGALGHGFPFAVGMALAGKMDGAGYRVFSVLGDGECQEGSIWEAAMFASHHRLGNLTAIIDHNKLQAMDRLDKIISMGSLAEKWQAFKWDVVEIDGHDIGALVTILGKYSGPDAPPQLVVAHTVKGKGVSFMEDAPLWHYRMPNEEEKPVLYRELGIVPGEINS